MVLAAAQKLQEIQSLGHLGNPGSMMWMTIIPNGLPSIKAALLIVFLDNTILPDEFDIENSFSLTVSDLGCLYIVNWNKTFYNVSNKMCI